MTKQRRIMAVILAMLLSCAMLFTACDKLSVKDVEKDPAEQVFSSAKITAESLTNAFSPLVPLKNASEKGTVKVELDNEELGKIALEFMADVEAERIAANISAEGEDSKASLSLNYQDKKLAVSSEELFEGAYGLDLTDIAEQLKDSDLLDAMGVDYDEIEEIVEKIEEYLDSSKDKKEDLKESLTNLKTDVKKRLNECEYTIAKEDAEIGGEAEVTAVTVTYALTVEDLYDIFEILVDWYKDFASDMTDGLEDLLGSSDIDEMNDSLDEALDSFKESMDEVDLDITLKLFLNPKTADVMRTDLNVEGKVDGEKGEISVCIDLGKVPSKSEKWTVSLESKAADGEKVKINADITRIDDKSTFSREIDISADIADEKKSIVVKLEHDKNAKSYKASLKMDGDTLFSAKGDMEYDDDSFYVSVDEIEVNEEEIEIGLKITVTAGADIPKMPEFKDVLSLTESDVEDLGEEIEKNAEDMDVFEALFSASKPEFAPGYGYDDDYNDDYGWNDDDYDYDDDYDDDTPSFGIGKVDPDETDSDSFEGEDYDELDDLDFKSIYASFDTEFDYDGDGDTGDREDLDIYENEYRPYNKFDEDFDYDDDGDTGDSDDYDTWEFVASFFGLI